MTTSSDTIDLVDIIEARNNLSRRIDEEFDGMPVEPRIKRWYDWNRRCYRVSRLLDCGGKRRQAPAPDIGPDKPPGTRRQIKAPLREQIVDYLEFNGPATRTELSHAFGRPLGSLSYSLYYTEIFECFYPDGKTYGEKLWRVK